MATRHFVAQCRFKKTMLLLVWYSHKYMVVHVAVCKVPVPPIRSLIILRTKYGTGTRYQSHTNIQVVFFYMFYVINSLKHSCSS